MKKEFIRLSGMLCLITLVAALLLAGVNSLTEERIAQASEKASQEAMQAIIPEATEFEPLSDSVYEAKNAGKTIGFAVSVAPRGFGGAISMMVGISADGTVYGIEILENSETPGLGAKAAGEDFKNQFKGKDADLSVVKTPTNSSAEIQAITGATITSRAVAEGVKTASQKVAEIKGGNK